MTMISSSKPKVNCFPEQLQCEYLVNPIGIDEEKPRLKWRINDQREGAVQQAYK